MPEGSLALNVVLFLVAAGVVLVSGTRLSALADRLADRTGLGEAMTGATLLGGVTSLPGITTSVTAAFAGAPELALSNAVGGIAAQTAFLGVADFFYPRVNLEYAAVSVPNILNGLLVIVLLAGVLLAGASPDVTVLGVQPVSFLLLAGYLLGLRLVRASHQAPQWYPRRSRENRPDVPDLQEAYKERLLWMWARFVLLAALLAGSGWLIARCGLAIAHQTGLGQSVVGGLFTAVSTSTPELVTTVAAVRRGALTLAVGGVLGGNAFDVMFAVASDFAYRAGSVYHAVSARVRFLTCLAVVMTGVLVMGMVTREKRGPANIGFESALILLLYVAGFVVLAFAG